MRSNEQVIVTAISEKRPKQKEGREICIDFLKDIRKAALAAIEKRFKEGKILTSVYSSTY